uniref:Putative secreted protein ovary overexpressed n=1 Tax=Rhipicephalus microplus TaxID=6941 RepID=A0A6M2DB26_RHIMP
MHNKIINPLTLFALLEAVAARPLLVQHGAPKPSRFDEYVTEPPHILGRAWLHEQTLSNSKAAVASHRAPAELAPAYGLRYHDVVYDASSETLNRYDTREGTYYPSAYRADGHEPSGSLGSSLATAVPSVPSEVVKRLLVPSSRLVTEAPRKAPFSVGYTREHDDWLLLSTLQHDPHWDDVSAAYRVPPFTTGALRR